MKTPETKDAMELLEFIIKHLPKCPEHPDRVQLPTGTKTKFGLARTLKRYDWDAVSEVVEWEQSHPPCKGCGGEVAACFNETIHKSADCPEFQSGDLVEK